MKNSIRLSILIISIIIVSSCQDQEQADNGQFTGNQVTYTLMPGDEWDFSGEVAFKELKDSTTEIEIQLQNTVGSKMFPAHLHYNSYNIKADLAALLNPVNASSGKSITHLEYIGDHQKIFYKDLINFDGHIKVHLDDGINKDVILSYGNIGKNCDKPLDMRIANCASK